MALAGPGQRVERVTATARALDAVRARVAADGPVIFYQSGGCCGGSLPMCFVEGELIISDHDVLLGEVGGCPFYMDPRQYATWRHTQLILDVADGEPEGFSLPAGDTEHFVTISRVFSPEELASLDEPGPSD